MAKDANSSFELMYDWYDPTQTRSPQTHPYNYDGYYIYGSSATKGVGYGSYSDRMNQQDSERFARAVKEAGGRGQYFDRYTPDMFNVFLSTFFDRKVKCTAVVQFCNQSNGYPYWQFFYEECP